MVSTFGGEVALEMQQQQEQAVRNRRARDEQRRARFLNARTRMMGVDQAFLDQQVAEKQARKDAEKAADRMYGAFRVRRNLLLLLLSSSPPPPPPPPPSSSSSSSSSKKG